MRLLAFVLLGSLLYLPGQTSTDDWRVWLNHGVQEFKAGRYQEAINALQKAASLHPSNGEIHAYLGAAWMIRYAPGVASPENMEYARNAESEFQQVLQLDPNNQMAMASLAHLAYSIAGGITDPDRKLQKFDEAKGWYEKLVAANPKNKEAWYTLGVIAWCKSWPPRMKARMQLGMRPDAPGPLPDPVVRADLRSRNGQIIEDGIANLEKAIAIEPAYDDAMTYLNLLYRERADLADTPEEYLRDMNSANGWAQKALATKRTKADAGDGSPQIRAGAQVQESKLIQKVDPVYPDQALLARIQGVVRMELLIGKDGRVENITIQGGHPLLVPAAIDAVKQWVYRPTLLNGEPVRVRATADVSFRLP